MNAKQIQEQNKLAREKLIQKVREIEVNKELSQDRIWISIPKLKEN